MSNSLHLRQELSNQVDVMFNMSYNMNRAFDKMIEHAKRTLDGRIQNGFSPRFKLSSFNLNDGKLHIVYLVENFDSTTSHVEYHISRASADTPVKLSRKIVANV